MRNLVLLDIRLPDLNGLDVLGQDLIDDALQFAGIALLDHVALLADFPRLEKLSHAAEDALVAMGKPATGALRRAFTWTTS